MGKTHRNLKLFNHWIAEVREIALGKCTIPDDDEEGKDRKPKVMGRADIKYYFDKNSMGEYFKKGLTPQEAFYSEVYSTGGH